MLIAGSIGLWIYLFLLIIGPFDVAPLNMIWRAKIMGIYGLIFALSYMATIPFQNAIVKSRSWSLYLELATIISMMLIVLPLTYGYYKSNLIQGEYNFQDFIIKSYLPTLTLIIPITFIARRTLGRKTANNHVIYSTQKRMIIGENRTDLLQIALENLVTIKSAHNYVEVYFLQSNTLNKKLIRTTLKNIKEEFPELIQVHRSSLININQPIERAEKNLIKVCGLEIPVSDTYLKDLEKNLVSRHT